MAGSSPFFLGQSPAVKIGRLFLWLLYICTPSFSNPVIDHGHSHNHGKYKAKGRQHHSHCHVAVHAQLLKSRRRGSGCSVAAME